MKRYGFANLYIKVMGILLFSILILGIMGYPLVNAYSKVTKSVNVVGPYVESKNGLERLYGKFYENMSYNETTSYSDLNKEYKITEKTLTNRPITLNMNGNGLFCLIL